MNFEGPIPFAHAVKGQVSTDPSIPGLPVSVHIAMRPYRGRVLWIGWLWRKRNRWSEREWEWEKSKRAYILLLTFFKN